MKLDEGKTLLDYARDCIAAMDGVSREQQLDAMKQFGSIAYQMGWNKAVQRAAAEIAILEVK